MRKLVEVVGIFRRNARRFLVAGLFTLIAFGLALVSGIGFTATVNITSSQILMLGHPCPGAPVIDCEHEASSCYCLFGWVTKGVMNFTFNPCLYPLNHLFTGEVSTNFTRLQKPWVTDASLKESLIIQTVLSEFPINIPLFYVTGFVLVAVLEKAIRRALGKSLSKK